MSELIVHYGDPFHHGGPSNMLIDVVLALTHTDEQGRRFYRESLRSPYKRLRTKADFERLNQILDRFKETEAA